jgi:hypothetical protein
MKNNFHEARRPRIMCFVVQLLIALVAAVVTAADSYAIEPCTAVRPCYVLPLENPVDRERREFWERQRRITPAESLVDRERREFQQRQRRLDGGESSRR